MAKKRKSDIRVQFGCRLRQLRLRAGLSQEALADAARLDTSYYASVERGERNVGFDNICRIADGLGRPVSHLFTGWRQV